MSEIHAKIKGDELHALVAVLAFKPLRVFHWLRSAPGLKGRGCEKTKALASLRARATARFAVFRSLRSQPVLCKTLLTCWNARHPPLSPSPKRNSTMLRPDKAVALCLRQKLASMAAPWPCKVLRVVLWGS
jgi:hypothetical protein